MHLFELIKTPNSYNLSNNFASVAAGTVHQKVIHPSIHNRNPANEELKALRRPNFMNGNLYKPKGIVMAVLQISSSATGIWLKALTRSMVEKILESDSWWFPANVLLGTGRRSCVCWVTGYLRKNTNRHSSCVLNAEAKTRHYQTSSQCHWAASLQTPVSLFLSRIGSKRRGRPKTCGTSVLRTYYVWEYLA